MTPDNIKTVVIAGAGLMGSSIAQILAAHGYSAVVYDIGEKQLESSRKLIDINQKELLAQKKITEEQHGKNKELISHTLEKACFKKADFVIEAIVENMAAKHSFWSEVSTLVREDAVLTSNTSGLSLTEIAKSVRLPARFAGMHWINPPHIVPLVEVIRGEETAEETAQAVYRFAQKLGKKPVLVRRDVPGFVLNRIQFAVLREALHIVESGTASSEDVDNVLKYGLGMRYAAIGPFETADLGGLDTFFNIASYLFADLSDVKEVPEALAKLVEEGNYGVKSGKGFYDYSGGKDEEVIRRRDRLFLKLADCLYSE